eukprot:c7009_g1_i1.p1 GENE.c7009_g1_i1~~c7009_g1_i1.p1  ORF type:complete len:303 (-),score=50.91 c7009_g1_i1:10-918(-)
MNEFQKVILKTHRSKYTQFLLFSMCAQHVEYARAFLSLLTQTFTSKQKHTVYRMNAVAYIASFVARNKAIPQQDVFVSFTLLSDWLKSYRSEFMLIHGKSALPTLHTNGLYYSVCQALMYIFCYHHKLILDPSSEAVLAGVPSGHGQYLRNCDLATIFGPPFHPLQVCLPDIVDEFKRVAQPQSSTLLPPPNVQSVTYKNALSLRTHLRGDGASAEINGTECLVEIFFPFDPYLLHKSSAFVKPFYRTWDDPAVQSESSASESDEETGSRLTDDGVAPMSFTPDCSADVFAHLNRVIGQPNR